MQLLHPYGESRRLLSWFGDDTSIELVTYADGSYGINQDGRAVGHWPASGEEECIVAFHRLGRLQSVKTCLVMSRAAFEVAVTAVAGRADLN
jgi:hypothetical protein